MLGLDGASSYLVVSREIDEPPAGNEEWIWHDHDDLLADIVELVRMKSQGSYIVYGLMLFMGLLAIFDTQVLAIWRRRREIGTLMALGMERSTVIRLFTFEGALHGVLAVVVGAVYGIPILAWTQSNGIPVPEMMNSMGMPVPQVLYPHYGPQLLSGTTLLILASVTIVSAIPASRIAKLKPTDAIRGKA
jgi:ABC-type lipoprotein release transport system permease subunit